MIYLIVNSKDLSHHGVKGMKWGVRHDRQRTGFKRSKTQSSKKKSKLRQFASDHPYITAGAAIAAVGLTIYGGKKLSDLYKLGVFTEHYKPSDVYKTLGSSTSKNLEVINDIPNLPDGIINNFKRGISVDKLSESNQKLVYKAINDGYFTNCTCCTHASALRRKGYDVVANASPIGGHTDSEVATWWKGAKVETVLSKMPLSGYNNNRSTCVDNISKILSSQGRGAYGDFGVFSKYSGHSVEYHVEQDGVKIYDYQIKKAYNSVTDFFNEYSDYTPERSTFVRLDNCEPNLDLMLKKHIIKPRGA